MLAVMRMKLSGSISATSKSTKTVSAVRLTAMFLKSWIAPKSRKSDKRLLARVLTLSTVVFVMREPNSEVKNLRSSLEHMSILSRQETSVFTDKLSFLYEVKDLTISKSLLGPSFTAITLFCATLLLSRSLLHP